jgi:predicted site-specific integrase-resolvase
MSENYLTAQEIAERRKVKPVTVRAWLKKGLFPNAKLEDVPPFGKVWRVPESDLKNFKSPIRTGRPKTKGL